ncbi:MAG: hypothetical protein OEY07_04280 [Gammaproteobacteria bacterium]|nr:hypothetical protein [Gammaproteobacteria bacterium]
MSEQRELTFKEISYLRAALEAYISIIKQDIEDDKTDEDERSDLQEDLLFYDKLLYTFRKAEKQSVELREVQTITIPKR